uniref:RanBP2-type domain-containing protein n=1 Tax=Aplanochytrium stocchinoi TaxID=215587 RepID=A0A7S3V0Z2_9STRA|mmetsp:Transcript_15903/g.19723  ORF Transcript_15903/g.19723 Transcript_15903/m.19723 type:complete len:360 (+) Transcript_15903:72-1151(+)
MEFAPSHNHIYAELLAEVENEAKESGSASEKALDKSSVESDTDDSDDDFADELESQLTNEKAKRHKAVHKRSEPQRNEILETENSVIGSTQTQIKNANCLNAILEAEQLENAACMSRTSAKTVTHTNLSSSSNRSEWRCPTCTFDNETTRFKCEMCNSQNPAWSKVNHIDKLPVAMIQVIFSFFQVGTRLGRVCKKFQRVNTIGCRNRIKELFTSEVGVELSQVLEGLLYGYCAAKVDQKYLQKSRSILLNLRTNTKQKSSVVERLKNGVLAANKFVRGIVGNQPILFASEEHIEQHERWCKQQMDKTTIKEQAPNGQGLFKCEHCKSQKIHYRLWKRKQQERYRNMLLCLDCRHQFEF